MHREKLDSEVLRIPVVECGPSAFQHIDQVRVSEDSMEPTVAQRISYLVFVRAIDERVDNLLGIADNGDVWAVRHHDDLPALRHLFDDRNEQGEK